ncbi:protein ELYS [Chanos chanos]|uniref:Protein ELYS n=1 Tax=Chanos chanos TaxID=29144 RepID=A0A6J2VD82_CHACN|nr:protein ELYS [Chanos chanos]
MRDLVAQVTSSLLRFSEVTVDALGEDEVTLDSVLHGKFTIGRSGLAWLACGPQLEVVHAVTGERFSAYCFSGVTEHPPTVLAVRDFSWLKRTGLLVGLEEAEGSILCLYDLGISRVVKAVVVPGRITAIEPLVSYGGASTSTQHLHQSLRWFFGVAAVVTDVGHVLLVDLCLDDLSCSQSELEASDLEVVNKAPSEIPRLRESVTRQGRHLCLQLSSPTGTGVTALQYIQRTNQLAVGFSDGYLQLWNMKTLKKEYHSQLEGGRVPVYAFTFQEPENDPRNCCYLWAVQSAQDLEGDVVSLHLLQLAFGERKCQASGKILYEGLEYCEERYSQDLNGAAFPLRAQATNTRLLSCQTIEKFRHHPDRDDTMNEVASPDTSVSIFSWQVKSYGQGQPSTFIGVFDINRWYHAQMPDSLRAGESLRNCPYLAVWSLDSMVEMTAPCTLLDVLVHERSLSRGLPYTCPPPEQFFNPTTYNFDASCLLNSGVVHLTCSGYQKETLSYLKKAAPSLGDSISNSYSRCLMSGLLSSRLADVQPSSLSQEEQLDAILSTAVETSSLGLITGCIKQWTAEEQPGSAGNLRYILEWAWDKVVHTKEELDGICAPLFDSSTNFTDPQTMQLLQHSQRLLSNLSTIFRCLLNEAHELTQKGLVGLINKNMVSSLISQYAQVVLWFCRTGLLPEGSDDDVLQISRPFYSYSVIKNYYAGQREELQRLAKGKWSSDCLMIDGMVAQCGERLSDLWKRDEGGTGQYPPPSLHALLDIYLLENIDEPAKHAIVIYLLLDVMYSFPNKSGASVESFPTAFAIPIGLVKLVQGLWLLDHHDHENSIELLLHPATSHSMWSWLHGRILQALMCQGQHSIALRYLHVMKPPMSTANQAKLCLSVLLHNRCIVEAWALLRQHSNKLNMEELLRFLYETCQELGLMKELLKLPLRLAEQECLERYLQGTGGLQNRELLMVHYLQQANYVPALQLNQALKLDLAIDRDPKMKERSNTRNSILNQYGKVLPRAQRKLAIERAKPYHHPSTIFREVTRPQPLSTVAKRSATENVLTRAGFINNVLSKIEEVWIGKDITPESSPLRSPREPDIQVPSPPQPSLLPEAFVGTPITKTSKRMSRIFDLVVQPASQNSPESSRFLGTPPKPISSWAAPKSISKAPELSLLQTPQVVKRARALAASGPVFSGFTPQSILRSSLRPTPVATPSHSPGRSVTPPLRPKESRITFVEEGDSPDPPKGSIHWSNGIAADNEISRISRSSTPPKIRVGAWSAHSEDEEEDEEEPHVSFGQKSSLGEKAESESGSSVREVPSNDTAEVLPLGVGPNLGHEADLTSLQTSDTTLESHDAMSSEDRMEEDQLVLRQEEIVDEEIVIVRRVKTPAEALSQSEADVTEEELPEVSEPVEKVEQDVDQEMKTEKEQNEQTTCEETPEREMEVEAHHVDEAREEKNNKVLDEPNKGEDVLVVEEPEPVPQVMKEPVSEAVNYDSETVKEADNEEQVVVTKETEDSQSEEVTKASENNQSEEVTEEPENNQSEEVRKELENSPSEEVTQELENSPSEEVTQEPENSSSEVTKEPESKQSEEMVPNHEPEAVEESQHYKVDEAEVPVEERDEEECMEHTDLDGFVERHLFGNDLSPPLTHSALKETPEEWTSFNSEGECNVEEEPLRDVPVLTTQKSVASASSEPETSESHSVVSLNDSDEFSSAASEEESDAEKEDSGSEVEIIQEVKGNGRQQPHTRLYMEEIPPHEQYLQEQATAVLSLVTPETQLTQVMDAVIEEEAEVVMLGVDPGNMEGDDAVRYTELKPSTTVLVPVELADNQQHDLVDSGVLHNFDRQSDDEPIPGSSGGFTLMLEAEDDNDIPIGSELDPHNHLLLMKPTQDIQQPEDVENVPVTNSEVLYLDHATEEHQEKLDQMECVPPEIVSMDTDVLPSSCLTHAVEHPEPPAATEKIDAQPTKNQMAEVDDEDTGLDSNEGQANGELNVVGQNVMEANVQNDNIKIKKVDAQKEEFAVKPLPREIEELVHIDADNSDDRVLDRKTNQVEERETSQNADSDEPSVAIEEAETEEAKEVETVENLKEVPPISTRKAASGRKTVTFPSPVNEVEKEVSDEEQIDSQVPSTPRRSTRSGKQLHDSKVPTTPRRSVRKADPTLPKDEEDSSSNVSKPSVPARRTPQKSTPRKGSRRTRNTNVDSDEGQTVDETLPNEEPTLPVRRSTRKAQTVSNEVPDDKPTELPAKAPASPSRVTRKSTRGLSLALESPQQNAEEESMAVSQPAATPPRSTRKTRSSTAEKRKNATLLVDDPQLQRVSRRVTRSRLWSHSEDSEKEREDRPLLETPLEVGPGTQFADALMERLKDEEAQEESADTVVTQIVRAKRRTTRSTEQEVPSQSTSVVHDQSIDLESSRMIVEDEPKRSSRSPSRRTRASKAPALDSSPVMDSFTFTAPLKATRGRKKVSAEESDVAVPEVLSPPVTRTRQTSSAQSSEEKNTGDEDTKESETAKPRRNKTTKTKAAPEPPPPVEVDLLSPLASPAEPAPRTRKKVEEKETPSLRMNLRRKRVMDSIFPKPVTRRKKL